MRGDLGWRWSGELGGLRVEMRPDEMVHGLKWWHEKGDEVRTGYEDVIPSLKLI